MCNCTLLCKPHPQACVNSGNAMLVLDAEEVGHDAHLCYSHMTLVCTSCCYAFRRMQFARVAGS